MYRPTFVSMLLYVQLVQFIDAQISSLCPDVQVQLVGGSSPQEGAIEYRCKTSGEWYGFCNQYDQWGPRESNAVCRHLGFGGATEFEDYHLYRSDVETGNLTFHCDGYETNLAGCIWEESGTCFSNSRAAAVCGKGIQVEGINSTLCNDTLSCRGNCGQAAKPGCRCDVGCWIFNDCCFDFEQECPSEVPLDMLPLAQKISSNPYYSCEQPIGSGLYDSGTGKEWFYFIRKCPPSTEPVLREQCESQGPANDVIRNLPVFDASGNIYYNIYCSLCHDADTTTLGTWTIGLQYKPDSSFNTTDENLNVVIPGTSYDTFQVTPPDEDIGQSRRCYESGLVIKTCIDLYNGSSREAACLGFQEVIGRRPFSPYYQNPYCLLCQEQESPLEFPFEYCSGIDYDCPNDIESDCMALVFPFDVPVFSVQVLFSFRSPPSPSEDQECHGTGEIYDIFLQECRVLLCPTGTKYINGTCSPYVLQTDATTPEPSNPLDCLKDIIPASFDLIEQVISEEIIADSVYRHNIFVNSLADAQSLHFSIGSNVNESMLNATCRKTANILLWVKTKNRTGENHRCESELFVPTFAEGSSITQLNDEQTQNNTYVSYRNYTIDHILGTYRVKDLDIECWYYFFDFPCELQVAIHKMRDITVADCAGKANICASLTSEMLFIFPNDSIGICSDSTTSGPAALDYVSLVCTGLSIVGTLATIVTYVVFPPLRNAVGRCLLNLLCSFLFALLLPVFNPLLVLHPVLCQVSAALIHLFWLSSFTWMTVIGVNMARTFGRKVSVTSSSDYSRRTIMWTILYAWGVPMFIVLLCTVFHVCQCGGIHFQYGSDSLCWIEDSKARVFTFGVPVAFSILMNIVLLVFTATKILIRKREGQSLRASRTNQTYENVWIVVKLTVVLGVAWPVAFFVNLPGSLALKYIVVIFTSLHGVYIFFMFAVSGRARELWKKRLIEKTVSSSG